MARWCMMHSSTFELTAFPPFRLDLTAWALRRRSTNLIDRWDDRRYSRIVALDDEAFKIDLTQIGEGSRPALQVTLSGTSTVDARTVERARSLIGTMFGLAVDLRPFYALAEGSDVLRPLVAEFQGLKPPRFPTVFEALVNAIACQQVSLDAGIRVLNRLSERFGRRFEDGTADAYSFPRPHDLTAVSEDEVKAVGLSRQKARAIKGIAKEHRAIEAALAGADRMTDAAIVSYLSTIRGIGRWSAEYVLLRGLGRLDTFPGDDVGARNNLQRLFHLDEKPDYDRIRELTSPWRPYQGLVYFHLLLNNLRAKGLV